LRTTNEESGLLLAELTTAFAASLDEPLKPCVDPCPGHLGEKGMAAVNEALARWDALRADLQQAEDENKRLVGKCVDFGTETHFTKLALQRAEGQRGELLRALAPFAKFAEQWARQPMRGIGDDFYTIHGGTEWEATLRLSDMRAAAEAVANAQAATRAAQVAPAVDPVHEQPLEAHPQSEQLDALDMATGQGRR
jgi:hypothetical protein